jgi:transcriptional regulator with XRE-family HTH domain
VLDRRAALGISQEALADRCGLDRTYVGGIERGHRNITLVSLMRLAAGLQAPVSALTEPLDEFLGLPE